MAYIECFYILFLVKTNDDEKYGNFILRSKFIFPPPAITVTFIFFVNRAYHPNYDIFKGKLLLY